MTMNDAFPAMVANLSFRIQQQLQQFLNTAGIKKKDRKN